MAAKCRNLLELKSFKSIQLVSGSEGLDNVITWVYINQSQSVTDWVHGGELVFITGLDGNIYDEDTLLRLFNECIDSSVSGVVILCNTNHIPDIPQSVITLSNSSAMPLFKMPWRLPLVDVTKDIANLIIMNQFQERSVSNFFYEILFSETFSEETSKQLGCYCGINTSKPAFVSIFKAYLSGSTSITDSNRLDSIMTFLKKYLDDDFNQYSVQHISYVYGDSIVCYTTLKEDANKDTIYSRLKVQLQEFYRRYSNDRLYIVGGLGTTYHYIGNIKDSYLEANHCIKYNLQKSGHVVVYSYQDLGIIQLLAKIKDVNLLKKYCYNTIGALISFDEVHHTDYVNTLHCYLDNDCNLIKTSKAMFIHRNTLVYRMDKIKEVLGNDLSSMNTKAEYINALKILEYFEL